MDYDIDGMIKYCSGIASEFEARLNRIRNFVPDHNLTSGTANEIILRDFLSQFSSGHYEVGQGFICSPFDSNSVSKQCDILVYDRHNYPLVHSEGSVALVFPQASKMVIEVKTNLDKGSTHEAMENISAAMQLNRMICGVIFAFKSLHQETIVRHLKGYLENVPLKYTPAAILSLDKGLIIHRWPSQLDRKKFYQVRASKDGNNASVVAFLLLLFFDVQMEGVWVQASIANAMNQMLDNYTEKVDDDILIGSDLK